MLREQRSLRSVGPERLQAECPSQCLQPSFLPGRQPLHEPGHHPNTDQPHQQLLHRRPEDVYPLRGTQDTLYNMVGNTLVANRGVLIVFK